ncbi:MAG: hypothetical protein ACYCXF_06160 [Thermoleophilia bacterium]
MLAVYYFACSIAVFSYKKTIKYALCPEVKSRLETTADKDSLHRIAMPEIAVIGNVDREIASQLSNAENAGKTVILDFSNSIYIEIASISYVISTIASRKKQELETLIALPKSRKVRDFLREWCFPEAIRDVSSLNFWDVVTKDGHKYFGETRDDGQIYKREKAKYVINGKLECMPSEKFFPFRTKNFNTFDEPKKNIAEREKLHWLQREIISVLRKHLRGQPTYVAMNIIYEAVMNAVQHSNSNIMQIASHFQGAFVDGVQKGQSHFTLVFWDDGESIIDTLRNALDRGENIVCEMPDFIRPFVMANDYRVSYLETDGEIIDKKLMKANYVPTIDDSKENFLFAATLPGISSKPVRDDEDEFSPDTIMEADLVASAGMGLFLIGNAAIDIYGGSVSYRTDDLFMNIKRAKASDKKAHYAVKIQKRNDYKFDGNLLTVRLPLQSNKELR